MRYCGTRLRSLLCYIKKFVIEEFVIRVFHCRVKWGNLEHMGNLERPCKSSVKDKLQMKFSVCNVSVN